jgi:hypothetical protein
LIVGDTEHLANGDGVVGLDAEKELQAAAGRRNLRIGLQQGFERLRPIGERAGIVQATVGVEAADVPSGTEVAERDPDAVEQGAVALQDR